MHPRFITLPFYLSGVIVFSFASVVGQPAKYDTLTRLTDFAKSTAYLKFNEKKYYKIRRYPVSRISYGERVTGSGPASAATKSAEAGAPAGIPASTGIFYAGAVKCSGNEFAGTARAAAKTHTTSGTAKTFATLDELFSSGLLVSDSAMRHHHPVITEAPTSPRMKEEKINVQISEVFIYGIYRESDNDFHMIIGNNKSGSNRQLLNAEVSGLPGDGNGLDSIRQKIIDKFGDISCNSGAFKPVGTPIPISIQGSIFFDIDHPSGKVGFGSYKPKTAWEIHPVIDIVFLDDQHQP
jgi:hypothetical protein